MDALALGGIVGAVSDVGVQISIAGVKDVAHHHAVSLADRVDGSENLRQLGAWNHGILHDEMRRQTAHRAERLLPALPQLHSLGVVASYSHLTGAAVKANAP